MVATGSWILIMSSSDLRHHESTRGIANSRARASSETNNRFSDKALSLSSKQNIPFWLLTFSSHVRESYHVSTASYSPFMLDRKSKTTITWYRASWCATAQPVTQLSDPRSVTARQVSICFLFFSFRFFPMCSVMAAVII